MGPKRAPRGPQEGLQRGPQRVPKRDSDPTWLGDPSGTPPGRLRDPSGVPFWDEFGPPNEPKIASKRDPISLHHGPRPKRYPSHCDCFDPFFTMEAPLVTPRRLSSVQVGARTGSDDPVAPGWPNMAPRWPIMAPMQLQAGPKRPQVTPRMTHLVVKWRFPFLVLKGSPGRPSRAACGLQDGSESRLRAPGRVRVGTRWPAGCPKRPREDPRGPPTTLRDEPEDAKTLKKLWFLRDFHDSPL